MDASSINFQDNFEGLAKLLSESEALAVPPRAACPKPSSKGPHGAGPDGIFPDVKVPAPKGALCDSAVAVDQRLPALTDLLTAAGCALSNTSPC